MKLCKPNQYHRPPSINIWLFVYIAEKQCTWCNRDVVVVVVIFVARLWQRPSVQRRALFVVDDRRVCDPQWVHDFRRDIRDAMMRAMFSVIIMYPYGVYSIEFS